MRLGIIDLGTNSVRFDVHQLGPGKRVRPLHRDKLMVRLGQGVFTNGKLAEAAIGRTLQAFQSFARTAQDLSVEKIVAFATSALREASDGGRLLKKIASQTGIQVRVISGAEEARLIAEGILSHVSQGKGTFALVDIGGGSTEISVCRGKRVLHSESFPLGTARLQQVFLKQSPPIESSREGADAIVQMRRYIKSVLLPKLIAEEWPKVDRIYGSSGTIRALAKLAKKSKGGKEIKLPELKRLNQKMRFMDTTELLGVPGMEARRVDMILAGGLLFEECMESLRCKRGLTTEYSLRDGILKEEAELFRKRSAKRAVFHTEELVRKAERFGINANQSKGADEIASTLFDRLKKVHKLKLEWRSYLRAAAILQNVGESVSPNKHGQHSYYIVKNSDLTAFEKWETECVAELCLRHKDIEVSPGDLLFSGNRERKIAFLKTLALLQVTDALDGGLLKGPKGMRVTLSRSQVEIRLKGSMELVLLRVEQRRKLFEKVFKRKLVVRS